jgi:IS1 family transposase
MADSCLYLLVLVVCLLWLVWLWHSLRPPKSQPAATKTTLQRLPKPRSPDDCPDCRKEMDSSVVETTTRLTIRPWCEVKSHRGAPKHVNTHGYACDNRACLYFGVTDSQVHALVGDGSHGKRERIQTLRCQACGATFSSRRSTPLYHLKTASSRVAEVLAALAEGLDTSAAVRVFGHSEATISRWLHRAGCHGKSLHERYFQNLDLPHLQLDKIRTRLRFRDQILWLWLALDPVTKLIPVLQLGPRTQESCHTVVHELHKRLMLGCLPVFTSDGLNLYYYALTAHFGSWVAVVGHKRPKWRVDAGLIYGQVKKVYRRRRLVRVSHSVLLGTREALKTALPTMGLTGKLNTAFVERVNLTIRQSVAGLVRRTWSTAQRTPCLLAHLEWWRAYYHFARPHESLRMELAIPRQRGGKRTPQRYRHRTPAMAAGLTDRCWTARDLLALPMVPDLTLAA